MKILLVLMVIVFVVDLRSNSVTGRPQFYEYSPYSFFWPGEYHITAVTVF